MTLFSKPASIKSTLLILLLPAGIALMGIAWLIHGLLLERMAQEFVQSRLQDEAAFLELHIRQADGNIDQLQAADYVEQVFHHAFAIQSATQTIISPPYWRPLLSPLLESAEQKSIRVRNMDITNGPADILVFRTAFTVKDQLITVIVSEDMAVLHASQAKLHVWTAVVSVLLITLLAGVIWLGIHLSMQPVVAIQTALKKLQNGDLSRISATAPEEFRPLVLQLNQLLDFMDQRLERSRDALANLSHSVKTPIAAVRQTLEDTDRPLNDDIRHTMAARLGDIDKQLEAQMRRSRFAGPQIGKSADPIKQARDLLWMFGRLYPNKSFDLSTDLTPDRRWPIEEHDLNEILGNLLDNAGKWSSRCVELTLTEDSDQLLIEVTDDGPGVSAPALDSLGRRGLRLDQQTPGHGLGLAIVQDIASRYNGRVCFAPSTSGGLRVSVEIALAYS